MKELNSYIIEKLHIGKNMKTADEYDEIKNIIDEILSKQTDDKYEVYFDDDHKDELYIEIKFDSGQDNSNIHNWGYDIFTALYDEEKFKPYNRGTDWWISSSKKIVFDFEYK